MKITRKQNVWAYPLHNFNVETLVIESSLLRGNALKDPVVRTNPILVPRQVVSFKKGVPVVLVLSGFTGNGSFAVSPLRGGDENHPQQIDNLVQKKKAPNAIYVFVDAFTKLGGSQFVDSEATGKYESYIVNELVPAIKTYYPASQSPKYWCLTGASSGGYGSLHLASKFPKIFGYVMALAPDCDFESCYHSDLLAASQFIENTGTYKAAMNKVLDEKLLSNHKYHQIVNGIAMAACYSAESKNKVSFPLDLYTGKWKKKILKTWKSKDPLVFIPKRRKNVLQLEGIYLGAGRKDEFFLNFGARKLTETIKKMGVSVKYDEFGGGHFDLSRLRPNAYLWLKKKWT